MNRKTVRTVWAVIAVMVIVSMVASTMVYSFF